MVYVVFCLFRCIEEEHRKRWRQKEKLNNNFRIFDVQRKMQINFSFVSRSHPYWYLMILGAFPMCVFPLAKYDAVFPSIAFLCKNQLAKNIYELIMI